VNADLLSTVDLNSAGFGVRWGDVMGSVLDAKTRPGQKDRLHTTLDMNMITTSALVEGPVGIGDASFTLSGRRSYMDLFFGKAFSGTFTAFPYFWDLGGSLDFSLNASNHFHALALASDDALGYSVKSDMTQDPSLVGDFHIENQAITSGISWVNTSWRDFTSTLTPYYYQTLAAESMGSGYNVNERQQVFGIKEEANWKTDDGLGMKHEVGFGGSAEVNNYSTHDYIYRNDNNGISSDPTGTTVSARSLNRSAYVQDRIQINPTWAVTAGLHYDKNTEIAGDVIMPRLSLEWQYDSRTLWKAAWGVYDQFPGGLQTNADFGNPGLSANVAEHLVLSLEKKFSHEFSGRIDAYYKNYHNLVVVDPAIQNYVNEGLGNAKGVEILLREDFGDRFSGWLSYAYSKSERLGPPDNGWSAYQYDQPHIMTLVANYKLQPAWSVGAKLHYNSGPLVKSLQGRYQDAAGLWQPIFSNAFDQRLGDYLRLDLRTDYSWRFEGWKLNAYFEVLNVLNRPNPAWLSYSKDYSQSTVINNLPRIPYCGLEVQF
jgi:outer membrane receptor for ferrienterochelin and colicin